MQKLNQWPDGRRIAPNKWSIFRESYTHQHPTSLDHSWFVYWTTRIRPPMIDKIPRSQDLRCFELSHHTHQVVLIQARPCTCTSTDSSTNVSTDHPVSCLTNTPIIDSIIQTSLFYFGINLSFWSNTSKLLSFELYQSLPNISNQVLLQGC